MKRMTYFVMAMALVLGFTQCKKEQIEPQNQGEQVRITLNVSNGNNNGSRAEVDPPHVNFETGDQILVASNGHYVGTLTHNGTYFSGNITGAEEDEYLYFYFLGNKTPEWTTSGSDKVGCTVDISEQDSELPVISFAPSDQAYNGTGSYTATLQNKCSLIKFDVTTPSTSPICITGMNNQVTVNFTNLTVNDGFSYGMADENGVIKMAGVASSGDATWAIVLKQNAYTTPGAEGTAYTVDGIYMGARPEIPAITMDQYLNEDRAMTVNTFTTLGTPLTLEALTAGTIVVSSPKSGMKYSKNDGPKNSVSGSITVAIGDKVRFYGNGTSITSYSGTKIAGGTAQVKAYGNMISLVKETDYTSATTLATEAFKEFFKGNTTLIDASGLLLPANVTLGTSSCQSMFSGCNKMTTAPAELPAALGTSCYRSLFYQCTSLTTVPALPVTTMCEGCYYQLFRGCTALTTVPADLLPATTMERDCYYGMFYGCTNLTTVPALPATQINDHCYSFMFKNCSKITTAPVLPAQTVPEGTYQQMFYGCSKLNSVTCYLTEVDVNFTAANWLDGVAATGTFTTPNGTSWPTGVNGIPSGWTRVDL